MLGGAAEPVGLDPPGAAGVVVDGAAGAGRGPAASGAPHCPQNLNCGGTSLPHCGQRVASPDPHCPQKRMPGGFSKWHCPHVIVTGDYTSKARAPAVEPRGDVAGGEAAVVPVHDVADRPHVRQPGGRSAAEVARTLQVASRPE